MIVPGARRGPADGAGEPAPLVSMLLREEDVEMRTEYDFGPLFRSSVGFDRMLDLLQHSARGGPDEHHAYPPYDIERAGEDGYRVTLAVAGFRPEELTVTAQQNLLVVAGDRRGRSDGGTEHQRQVLYRGIAGRAFERRFELADHMKVVGADLSRRPAHHRAPARGAGGDAAAPDRDRRRGQRQRAPRAATAAAGGGRAGRLSQAGSAVALLRMADTPGAIATGASGDDAGRALTGILRRA